MMDDKSMYAVLSSRKREQSVFFDNVDNWLRGGLETKEPAAWAGMFADWLEEQDEPDMAQYALWYRRYVLSEKMPPKAGLDQWPETALWNERVAVLAEVAQRHGEKIFAVNDAADAYCHTIGEVDLEWAITEDDFNQEMCPFADIMLRNNGGVWRRSDGHLLYEYDGLMAEEDSLRYSLQECSFVAGSFFDGWLLSLPLDVQPLRWLGECERAWMGGKADLYFTHEVYASLADAVRYVCDSEHLKWDDAVSLGNKWYHEFKHEDAWPSEDHDNLLWRLYWLMLVQLIDSHDEIHDYHFPGMLGDPESAAWVGDKLVEDPPSDILPRHESCSIGLEEKKTKG